MLPSPYRQVRVPEDLESVTTVRHEAEVDPRQVGMTQGERDAIWRSVERIYRGGTQPAIGLCIRKRGQVVLDRTIGHARGNGPGDNGNEPKVLATPDTPFCMFSASKAVAAMVVHLLDQLGQLHIDDPVAEYIPEFATHGKGRIRLRDLLTHRAGIPSVPGSQDDPEMLLDLDRVLHALCDAKPQNGGNGNGRSSYHALSGGYLLGEVVRRATGKTLREVMHERILAPLAFEGMNFGVEPERANDVAVNYDTGLAIPFPASMIATRALGVTWSQATTISNHPRFLTGIIPSANIMTTPNEASRFYQLLLDEGELDGVRIFEPRTIRRARTGTRRLVVDGMLLAPVRYGLGLLLGDRLVSPYGPGTPQAFGHPGFLGILCWADPQRELAVGLLTTGKTVLAPQWRGFVELLLAIGRAGEN